MARRLIGKRRGDTSRLGFALQLTTARYLGTFLDEPLEVPSTVVDALAVQLAIADASCVKSYVGRANTKWERRREICGVDGWREFASVREELTGEVWETQRESLMNSLQLPDDPGELLAECSAELDSMWRQMAAQVATGDITVEAEVRVHAAALTAIAEPVSLVELRRRCQALMPRLDIGELILEVMSWHPEFAAYAHISGGVRISGNLDLTLAAVLTAQALNVGWGPVVSPGVEALTRSRIGHVYQNFVVRGEPCRRQRRPHRRGGRDRHRRTVGRRAGRRRGRHPVRGADPQHRCPREPEVLRPRKGSALLNMINDQGVGLAGMVLAGTLRDSLYAVDLMYRRDGGQRPQV